MYTFLFAKFFSCLYSSEKKKLLSSSIKPFMYLYYASWTWSCNGHINPSWAKFALFSKPHENIQNTALHIWYGPWNIFNATLWVLMLFYTLNQNFNSCQKSKLWWFLNFHTIFGVKIQISKTCNITEQL